jgi:hypothetical protein
MQQKKRRHHYLPRYYLGGFPEGGDKGDPLFVWSKTQNRSWTTRAEGAAHKRDLFKPEGAQFEADEFEDGFASIEGLIAPVLKGAIQTEVLPDTPGLGLLLHLVALNAARPPAEIANLEDIVDENLRRGVAEEMTVEVHQRILDEWRAEGRDTTHVEDLQALKERILKGGVRVVMPRDYTLVMGVLGSSGAGGIPSMERSRMPSMWLWGSWRRKGPSCPSPNRVRSRVPGTGTSESFGFSTEVSPIAYSTPLIRGALPCC